MHTCVFVRVCVGGGGGVVRARACVRAYTSLYVALAYFTVAESDDVLKEKLAAPKALLLGTQVSSTGDRRVAS